MKLNQITNGDGMSCRYTYAVYSGNDLLAVDLIGADAAVKAVWATLIQHKKVKLDTSWRQMRVPREMEISTLRTVLEQEPLLCRWHIIPCIRDVVPQPSENDLSVVVYGWEVPLPADDAFIGALGRWTVWPTLPGWAKPLYDLGRASGLVERLDSEGVDYAFAVTTTGWDAVIDRAVKEGRLLIPDA
ncbi:MAG: hypothetical protein JXD18_14955 [Anaerolineae bacterium]|nr:hypothetical protein [Anaerolineae bacterium]